jgi:flagellar FliL protein
MRPPHFGDGNDFMSDATADGEDLTGEGEGTGKSGKGKIIKIAGAGGVLLVVVLAAVYFFLGGSSTEMEDTEPKPAVIEPSVFFELPEMTVNLTSSGPRAEYLKLKISLEVANQGEQEQISTVMPRVIDAFQVYLRELRPEDLRGSAGMFRIKDELRKRVNAATAPVMVRDVLFQEMLVQ